MASDFTLHIGPSTTRLTAAGDVSRSEDIRFNFGDVSIAAQHFRRPLPSALELENAIAAIEDEITRVKVHLAPGTPIRAMQQEIHVLARQSGQPDNADTLTLESVEALFQRLCARALGRPATQDPTLADDALLAARLVVLRELMHHLGLSEITLNADATGLNRSKDH